MTGRDNDRYVLRGRPVDPAAGGVVTEVTPERAGWGWSGLEVRVLPAGGQQVWDMADVEAVLLPLSGGCTVHGDLADGTVERATLTGRDGVFSGPTDAVYLPLGTRATVTAPADRPVRLALATARAQKVCPWRAVAADQVRVDLRGAGAMSRQVNNYTLGTDVQVDHLLVCEVITPGGNWSSYPPHKHDEHAEHERALEEIYWFEVADGPAGPGSAFQQVYGTADRPIDVLAQVRTGDTVLVPHGYHGPCMAAPGHDLYYLNVMAGPAEDGQWLSVDDPTRAWLRDTWADLPLDPRLPVGGPAGDPTDPTHRAGDDAAPRTQEQP